MTGMDRWNQWPSKPPYAVTVSIIQEQDACIIDLAAKIERAEMMLRAMPNGEILVRAMHTGKVDA